MTLLQRRRRPRPFVKFSRADYERMLQGLRDEITRQVAARRAQRDWIASALERRAASYRADAAHQERAVRPDSQMPKSTLTAQQRIAIADELCQLAVDLEEGPDA